MSKQILEFGISVILARLLTPQDFGLVGMVFVFTGFISLFSELGFGAALIQRKDVYEQHLSSVFWLNIAAGFLIMIFLAVGAPLIGVFYNEPRLVPLTRLLSLNFLIGAFKTVHTAIITRSMNFKLLALLETTTVLIAGILAVVLALSGFGVWSLAWQLLCLTTLQVIVIWIFTDWRPQLQFHKSAIQELWKFSSNLVGFRIINYWVRNADNLLVGKFVGSAGLGIYTRSYSTMLMPLTQVTWVLSRVMFPALSKIQDDIPQVKQVYFLANRAIALVTMPMVCGLLVVTKSFVLTLYGPKWESAIPIIQILCLIAISQPIGSTVGWIYGALGRTDIQFRWAVIRGSTAIIAFIIGVQWGIMGVAIAYVVRGYLVHYHSIVIPGRLIGVSFKEYHLNVASVFGCAVAMAGLVWCLGLLLPSGWPHWSYLTVQVPSGMAIYWGLIHIFRLNAYQEVRTLIWEHVSLPL